MVPLLGRVRSFCRVFRNVFFGFEIGLLLMDSVVVLNLKLLLPAWEQQETCQDVSLPKKCSLFKSHWQYNIPNFQGIRGQRTRFQEGKSVSIAVLTVASRQPSTPTSPLSCGSPSKRHYPNARAEKNSQPCGSRHQEEKLKEIDKNCAALSDETVETFVASHHELDFKKPSIFCSS